jgi:hypothetical protein
MPLLNAFIKVRIMCPQSQVTVFDLVGQETLRFYPAEAFAERMVVEDTIIPLSESITTSTGEQVSEISVSNGQIVIVGIASYHRFVIENVGITVCSGTSADLNHTGAQTPINLGHHAGLKILY